MKRRNNFPANLLRAGALVAGLSAAAANWPSDGPRQSSFDVSTAGLVNLSLPLGILDSPCPAPGDLSLSDAAGNETPDLIEPAGAALDISAWRFRKPVKISAAGAQQVELDLDVLAHAQAGLADLRVMRGSNQVPCLLERTALSRLLVPGVAATNEAGNPQLSRWIIRLPRAGLPLTRLTCVARTALFERSLSLYEQLADERGGQYRQVLGGGLWQQTPERPSKDFALELDGAPRSGTLFLETENGDNPPVELEKFQVFYPATHILFKAKPGDELYLYYGNARVALPRYDLRLAADQLLAAEKNAASLSAEEQLRSFSWREDPRPGQGGLLFWGILAAVVVVLLMIIARLLPKAQATAKE